MATSLVRDAPEDFAWFCGLVREKTSIVLDTAKDYLVDSRLLPLARRHGDGDTGHYLGRLRQRGTAAEHWEAVEAMTTNETSWFRDSSPFLHLRDRLLPELVEARRSSRSLRVWSAACSSGQEPYGISMVIQELPQMNGWHKEIVATDIDRTMLARARSGTYSQLEVGRGLPVAMMMRHLQQQGGSWVVSQAVRAPVRFAEVNLALPFPGMGTFDIVFCRNVLIYFDAATKKQVLDRIRAVIAPDGALVLGAAETTLGISTAWTRDASSGLSIYRPAPMSGPLPPRAARPAVPAPRTAGVGALVDAPASGAVARLREATARREAAAAAVSRAGRALPPPRPSR